MCGITGIFSLSSNLDSDLSLITRMTERLSHRGPDAIGVWGDQVKKIQLGHARLSILELSEAGSQPMNSMSGRYTIVFNGEIYNHQTLRTEITNINWRGSSDTETLLASIECFGLQKTLDKISGMFAFALWDSYKGRLTLARDRFGEKPLYYSYVSYNNQEVLIFSSELKALKAHPAFNREIDRSSLSNFLQLGYIPSPNTIYQGVNKLLPGSTLVFELNIIDEEASSYWDSKKIYANALATPMPIVSEFSAVNKLDNILNNVISEQILADVPVGAFLSGGIDSSAVVAIMQSLSSTQVNTYTIGYNEPKYSEAEHASSVAKYLGTAHNELYVTESMAFDVISKLPTIYDEPFADPSQIPTYLVSELASKSVKVALSGDGGDEMFVGYNRYWMTDIYWKKISSIPGPLRSVLSNLLTAISQERWDNILGFLPLTNIGFKLHKAAKVISCKNTDELYRNLITLLPSGCHLVKNCAPVNFDSCDKFSDLKLDPIHKMVIMDIVTYLCDDILVKVDRAAMSCSLETRAPLLDRRVADFAWHLPLNYKLRGKESKWILRSLLYKYVPKALIDRPKMGFGFPIDLWLRSGLRDWATKLLDPLKIQADGYLEAEPINIMWQEHLSGKRNWAMQLWPVLMFQAWLDNERIL